MVLGNELSPAGARSPKVGIAYVVRGRVFIESTPLANAADYGEFKIHEGGHLRFWSRLVSIGAVPPDSEYAEHPRGRANYNTRTGEYALYLDRCILRNARLVARIIAEFALPAERTTTATDPHYLCHRCLRRMGEQT